MSKVNLKNNIWIEGFGSFITLSFALAAGVKPIYAGKTSEIPEELAKECVLPPVNGYRNYKNLWINVNTAKESIQSACPEEYCIIYKTN